jgi:hypothetical protein
MHHKEGSMDIMDRTYLCIENKLNPIFFEEDITKFLLFGWNEKVNYRECKTTEDYFKVVKEIDMIDLVEDLFLLSYREIHKKLIINHNYP